MSNANTAALSGEPQFTGWCLDKEDLCVAKLCALRDKDRNFVTALIESDSVDPERIAVLTCRKPMSRLRRLHTDGSPHLASRSLVTNHINRGTGLTNPDMSCTST